ncbi:hypothetical protein AAG565_05420 [Fontimonas sp. SYSU GA230001]|uniref:hypothetical protein n=1 Tax=Fontimonas sp. SYSU GA230001 TaxID=3142450 RepID=UPI0032B3FE22
MRYNFDPHQFEPIDAKDQEAKDLVEFLEDSRRDGPDVHVVRSGPISDEEWAERVQAAQRYKELCLSRASPKGRAAVADRTDEVWLKVMPPLLRL